MLENIAITALVQSRGAVAVCSVGVCMAACSSAIAGGFLHGELFVGIC